MMDSAGENENRRGLAYAAEHRRLRFLSAASVS